MLDFGHIILHYSILNNLISLITFQYVNKSIENIKDITLRPSKEKN